MSVKPKIEVVFQRPRILLCQKHWAATAGHGDHISQSICQECCKHEPIKYESGDETPVYVCSLCDVRLMKLMKMDEYYLYANVPDQILKMTKVLEKTGYTEDDIREFRDRPSPAVVQSLTEIIK